MYVILYRTKRIVLDFFVYAESCTYDLLYAVALLFLLLFLLFFLLGLISCPLPSSPYLDNVPYPIFDSRPGVSKRFGELLGRDAALVPLHHDFPIWLEI
ncbi:predicted protein [Plenodomus lingam JN3]|uniref:Uncharacterized protein n=1 Tax=Leptosphaeria maculans (strain JN3 / isolate v23.1.3 / race Av1-4-5-6-7-8) TaxID=985895 RepID=E5A7Q3_LEPMJ|nr:predicted protein [Plenodomus lingam JN3]CBX99648.1 predicted protein [Plenodomus lingam JN3]